MYLNDRDIVMKQVSINQIADDEILIPIWQRWVNDNLVKALSGSLKKIGQLRPIIVCITQNGVRILTDGQHLARAAALNGLTNVWVAEIEVEDEDDAHQIFITFNKVGRKLNLIDFLVSNAGIGKEDYQKFMATVLNSPKNVDDINSAHNFLSAQTLAITLFDSSLSRIKDGDASLKTNWRDIYRLLHHVDSQYHHIPSIKQMRKDGRPWVGTASLQGIFISIFRDYPDLLACSKSEFLDLIVEFTEFVNFSKIVTEKTFTQSLSEHNFIKFMENKQDFLSQN